MRWQDRLTKKQLKHIKKTTTSGTLTQFKLNRKMQNEQTSGRNSNWRCYECNEIAKRLGVS